MVGLKDIARAANVSVSTVSNVLNGRKNVGKETKDRILRLCEEMGYQPNIMGKSLKTGQTNTIVFNFSDFERSFYLKIIKGIHDYLSENDFDLIVCTTNSSKNFMRGNFTRGAIVLDKKMADSFLASTANSQFPIVVMDRMLESENIKSVITENYSVMSELTQVLIDKGFRHFGYLGGMETSLDHQERYQAFTDTLAKNNITFQRTNYYHGDFSEQSGYRATNILILSNQLPEILMCANDNMAIGAIKALRENHYDIPKDISITGFDDSSNAENFDLTTVTIPRYESGYIAAKELVEMIHGTANKEDFKITAKINWRGSVK
ncbi:LacI family transcriptional regulator [Bacillus sp. J14TS2]|uniref:LacI family DNA-binding transcriptional regulator n=1 Tax=Bacillus sp. J14TS2 TaxID=2807188 RepID=UPI001B0FF760|nr:LacI family DNA-binding transcriptional regulator [Bacillus sp. J14TS2]GIN72069.1 LacI family transcriptional regulator [Bacillus sp. J14TS2]